MATNYPGSLDSFTNPSSGDALTSPSHSAQHANANDAIEAIETELGTTPKGSAATVKARLDGIENGTRLAAGSVTNAALASGIDGAKLSPGIGNLLTANQASGTDTLGDTTGFASYNATLSRSTAWAAQGSGSLLVTATGTGVAVDISPAGTAGIPVTPGETVTATATVKGGTSTDALALRIIFWDSGGSVVSSSQTYVTLSGTPQTPTVTATVPAGAAFVSLAAIGDSMTSGDTYYIDKAGLWFGAGGTWAMPGQVIPGTSHIADNGAFQTSGTVAPEGVITAPPLSRYLQTSGAATATGAMEWVKASGTGNTGWVAGAEADTGWRSLLVWTSTDTFTVGTTPDTTTFTYEGSGQINIRRVGAQVHLRLASGNIKMATGSSSSSTGALVHLPSGFQSGAVTGLQLLAAGFAFQASTTVARQGNTSLPSAGNYTPGNFALVWATTDAWPSSLPGTAA